MELKNNITALDHSKNFGWICIELLSYAGIRNEGKMMQIMKTTMYGIGDI
jgi:hypothetical protein